MNEDTIPLSNGTQRTLLEIATKTGQSPTTILDAAIEDYRRKVFFEEMDAGYAAMRTDLALWTEEQSERNAWNATNADGLDEEPTGDPQ
jgi:predicted transcriptional regulator